MAVFAGTLATRVVLLPPRDPESKGIVGVSDGLCKGETVRLSV